jgi:hypothetical protein
LRGGVSMQPSPHCQPATNYLNECRQPHHT